MPHRIRCVTFDCYGTLVDWEGGIHRALMGVECLAGRPDLARKLVIRREEIEHALIVSAPDLPDEESPEERYETPEYRPYRGILAESLILAARELDVELDPRDAQRVAASMPLWEPFPDTRDALRTLARRFPLGILSNVENEVIEETIRKLGVSFEIVVTAEGVESYKPAPDHWYAAMHELGADEEELFHLAASPFHDLETASLLGIPCGHVNRVGGPLLAEARPLFSVRDLSAAAERLSSFPTAMPPPAAPPRRGRGTEPRPPTRLDPRPGKERRDRSRTRPR